MAKRKFMHGGFRISPETEAITKQFYSWDYRLRGYDLFEYPIHPEPVYRPFANTRIPILPISDDARRPHVLVALYAWVKQRLGAPIATEIDPGDRDEGLNAPLYIPEDALVEYQVTLPKECDYSPAIVSRFFSSLRGLRHPLSFEIIGTSTHIVTQFACRESDTVLFASQLSAFFPEAVRTKRSGYLEEAWYNNTSRDMVIIDMGLSAECGLQLTTVERSLSPDPFIGLMAALETLEPGECAVYQVTFIPANANWGLALMDSVTDYDGTCILADAPELLRATQIKVESPLFSVVVRVGAMAESSNIANQLVQRLVGALGIYDAPTGNQLIPLSNEYYPVAVHEQDLLYRLTHRTGMLLSSPELIGLVHLPTPSIVSKRLLRADLRTKACPRQVLGHDLILGTNAHQGTERTVSLSLEQRLRHTYIVGASGTGKSNLLLNLISQDLKNGQGLALLDPHGDLVDAVLRRMPAKRAEDVIVFDPSDDAFPIGFNIFHAHSEEEKILLASDLTKTFERLSTSWGDRMNTVLSYGILAMLEHPAGGTLLTLRRFLTDKAFKRDYLAGIIEPEIRYFWEKEFPLLSGRPEAPVLTRLDTFLRTKTIRNMVAQTESRIDFSKLMDERKILLVKLSQGAIGEENAYLLGTLIVTAIHQAALRRQLTMKAERVPFFLYLDEFQNFVTPAMESILSGARKYHLGLILAHQERRQLLAKDREVASSTLSNPYTRICFRLGYEDASNLAKGLSYFDANDLQNLGIGEAIVRSEQAQQDFNLAVPWDNQSALSDEAVTAIIERSQVVYGTLKATVEATLDEFYDARKSEPSLSNTKRTTERVAESPPAPIAGSRQSKTNSVRKTQPLPPPLMGRGGPQHKYLQQLIKKVAEGYGYRATIEHQLLDGSGSVDVLLEIAKQKIACEVSVTTPASHETANIRKCLAAGFAPVILIAADVAQLKRLRAELSKKLSSAELTEVRFLLPEEFLNYLEHEAPSDRADESKIRGYNVSVNYRSLSADEQRIRREAIAKVIVHSMKRLEA